MICDRNDEGSEVSLVPFSMFRLELNISTSELLNVSEAQDFKRKIAGEQTNGPTPAAAASSHAGH